jgi:hypothetical protein
MLLHGHYEFRTRRAVCRNDYCTQCQRAAFTEGFRSLCVIHIFFIPLIPLGFVTDWRCTSCGKDPLSRRPLPRPLAWAGLAFSLFALIAAFAAPGIQDEWEERLLMAAIFGVFALLTTWSLLSKKRARYEALRRRVEPLKTDDCPYCHAPMLHRATIRCEQCRVIVK